MVCDGDVSAAIILLNGKKLPCTPSRRENNNKHKKEKKEPNTGKMIMRVT